MKHKKLLIFFISIFTVFVALGTFLLIWFCGDSYPDFNDFSPTVSIPGLREGAVPQGVASYNDDYEYMQDEEQKTAKQDYYFVSSYMKKGPSRIYVTGSKTGYIGYVTMKNEDGSDYTGHCGGVATNGYTFWLTSDDTVFVLKTAADSGYTNAAREIIGKAAKPEGENTITFTASFAANCNASFCFYYDAPDSTLDKLYVGEFYRAKNYETDERHHLTTKVSQAENKAFCYEYSVTTSSSNKYGLTTLSSSLNLKTEDLVPKIDYVYSITDEIQGFARTKDGLVLSRSWGLKNSTLYYHDWNKIHPSAGASSLSGKTDIIYSGLTTKDGNKFIYKDVSVYYVDNSSLIREYSIPSMSEGLCCSGGKVQVLFESASYKYNKFVRCQLKDIYGFIPRAK